MSVVGEIYGNDKVFPRVAECLYLKGRYVALAYIYTYIYSERIISRIVPVSFISLDMYDDGVYIVHTYVHARVSNRPFTRLVTPACVLTKAHKRYLRISYISLWKCCNNWFFSPTRFSRCHANCSINKGKDYHLVEYFGKISDRIIFVRFYEYSL